MAKDSLRLCALIKLIVHRKPEIVYWETRNCLYDAGTQNPKHEATERAKRSMIITGLKVRIFHVHKYIALRTIFNPEELTEREISVTPILLAFHSMSYTFRNRLCSYFTSSGLPLLMFSSSPNRTRMTTWIKISGQNQHWQGERQLARMFAGNVCRGTRHIRGLYTSTISGCVE